MVDSGEGTRGRGAPSRQDRRGARRQARELVVQALYQCDVAGDAMERAVEQLAESEGAALADMDYFYRMARGVWRRREELDRRITDAAEHWALERLSIVDRNILRLGLHELLSEPELPAGVIINEAIELSKRFGGEGTSRFVNGILDQAAKTIRGGEGTMGNDTGGKG